MAASSHIPVLLKEVIHFLNPVDKGVYVDGTVGGGGHLKAILDASCPAGIVIGFDKDINAINRIKGKLSQYKNRLTMINASFSIMHERLVQLGIPQVDGVILDLGISSLQLDDEVRGFSFQKKGPLDMRMDISEENSAWHIVNQKTEDELARIIRIYGEEKFSRRIARAICKARLKKSIDNTVELATLIAEVIPKTRRHHPATRTFQALRIEVNHELDDLKLFLNSVPDFLKEGGRLGVISFHSLEDRLVKQRFKELSTGCICPRDMPVCGCGHKSVVKNIIKKAVKSGTDECAENPRSRSARLRFVERL